MSNGRTIHYGLYGQPVSHSFSPQLFNRTFEALGMNCSYEPYEVAPDQLPAAVEDAKSRRLAGFNVTMPLKVAIVPLLNNLSSEAAEIGAVNTVVDRPGGFEGHNTDGEGAIRAIRVSGFEPKRTRVLVIGAGGSARAIVHRLSSDAETIVVLNRSAEKSQTITDRTKGAVKTYSAGLSRSSLDKEVQCADLIVNATPVLTPDLLNRFSLPPTTIRDTQRVFDLAYTNSHVGSRTHLTVHPLEMLLQQAALSFELWFGSPAPIDLMQSTLSEQNGGNWR